MKGRRGDEGRGEGRWCRGRTGGAEGAPMPHPSRRCRAARQVMRLRPLPRRCFGFGFAGLGRAAPNPGVLGLRSSPRYIRPCEPGGGVTFLTREDTMTMVLTVL